MQHNSSTTGFRPDLQGLRAIAITLVILAHADVPGFAGGFIGVDVFFVLSGFLITGLLLREHEVTGGVRFVDFVARRLRRLLPALLVMLFVVMLLARGLLTDYEFVEQTASAAYAATWTSNLFFAFTTFDYFAELHERDLFLHTWSLGVEEQFYLIWPLLMLIVLRLTARRGPGVHDTRLQLTILGLLAISLLLSLHWSTTQSMWAFYLMPSRIWQFSLGALVFVWVDGRRHAAATTRTGPLPWSQRLSSMVGIAAIVLSAMVLHPGLSYPGAWALLPSVGAAAVIAAGSGASRRSPLAHPALVWLGDRSYSLYLWHWPLLMLGFAWGLAEVPSAVAALVALAVLLATASYRWVELPFWKGRWSGFTPGRSVGYAVVLIAVFSTAALNLRFVDDATASGAQAFARDARNDGTDINGLSCDDWLYSAALRPCIVGDDDAPRTAVLLGDSVGVQWYPVLPAVFGDPQWKIVVLTKSSCAMVDEDYVYDSAGGGYEVCSQWRDAALEHIRAMRPDIVFVGSASTYAFNDRQWEHGSRRVFERLAASAADVVVIPGTPLLSFDGPACLERALRRADDDQPPPTTACTESLDGKPAQRVTPLLSRAADADDRVRLLDLNDLVCPDGLCAARQAHGPVVYRDSRHLTNTFAIAQRDAFRRRLLALDLPSLRDLEH